ncbi:hypothetical protein [Actinomyces sp. ZJ308]|uniref:hypothetical protein n=1 Tax=Actinomyces sp. ZJ308 TaxID=2708342 RepID=UPI00141DB7CB|nr:hypothetical protein [Actinomyces sp. ZJ308]
MARSLAMGGRLEASRLAARAPRARSVGDLVYADALDAAAVKVLESVTTIETASLHWVSASMARLAMDASQDLPAATGQDAPAPSGLMVLAEPLPAWSTALVGGLALCDGPRTNIPYIEAVPVDALAWQLSPPRRGRKARLTIELFCRSSRLPLPVRGLQSESLASFARISSRLPVIFAGTVGTGPDGEDLGAAHVGVLSWLQAAWSLMSDPGIVQTSMIPEGHPAEKGAAGSREADGGNRVAVVDLHPDRHRFLSVTRHEGDVEPDGSHQHPVRSHVVRGHWDLQSHGTPSPLGRLQWVDDHVCGLPGTPLVARPHVWAWRHP